MKRLLLLGLACVIPVAYAAEPLTADQFDWQQAITTTPADAAIYRFELPEAVHAGVQRPDLGDIRIFNGAGEVVPHALINDEPTPQTAIETSPVSIFPLRHSSTEGDVASGSSANNSVSIVVQRTAGGTSVSTHLNPPSHDPTANTQTAPSGYVINARAIKHSRRALFLNWQPQPDGTVLTVHIDGSDDLQTWHQLGVGTQLVDLRSGDQHLQHQRVDLLGSHYTYYRLRWPADQNGIAMTSASIETTSTAQAPRQLRWSSSGPVRPGSTPGEFLFESAAQPVAQVRLDLPHVNTVVPLQLSHRRNEHDTWRVVANTVAYRLMRNKEELRSPPIELCCSSDRYWRISVDQRGGGIGSGLPEIELGWRPQNGLFIARGPAPFLLAYGKAKTPPAAFAAASLIPGYRAEQYPDFPAVSFDAPIARATPIPALADQPAFNWRSVALWSVLIAGVLLLAFMAWRLLRQMGPPP